MYKKIKFAIISKRSGDWVEQSWHPLSLLVWKNITETEAFIQLIFGNNKPKKYQIKEHDMLLLQKQQTIGEIR
jgi:hypothetical protein